MWRVSDTEAKVGWAGARLWVLTIMVSLKRWESHLFCVYMYVCVCFIEKFQTEVEWTMLRIPVLDGIIIKIDHICFLFISFFSLAEITLEQIPDIVSFHSYKHQYMSLKNTEVYRFIVTPVKFLVLSNP